MYTIHGCYEPNGDYDAGRFVGKRALSGWRVVDTSDSTIVVEGVNQRQMEHVVDALSSVHHSNGRSA